ncbi:MAG: hypothetical protein IJK68_08155, partial [Muribaculaceae bacterium]|nr:hypothetical protein [Muribaculaceae bacterium]
MKATALIVIWSPALPLSVTLEPMVPLLAPGLVLSVVYLIPVAVPFKVKFTVEPISMVLLVVGLNIISAVG